MPCQTVKMAHGTAIVCTRGRRARRKCAICGMRRATRLCDFPRGCGRTCDKPLCRWCAIPAGPDRDLCPKHAREEFQGDFFREAAP